MGCASSRDVAPEPAQAPPTRPHRRSVEEAQDRLSSAAPHVPATTQQQQQYRASRVAVVPSENPPSIRAMVSFSDADVDADEARHPSSVMLATHYNNVASFAFSEACGQSATGGSNSNNTLSFVASAANASIASREAESSTPELQSAPGSPTGLGAANPLLTAAADHREPLTVSRDELIDSAASACDGDPARERAHRVFGPVLPADDAALYRAGFAPTEVYELRRPSRRRPRAPPGWTHRIVPAAPQRCTRSSPFAHTKHRRKRFLLPDAAVSIETHADVVEHLDRQLAPCMSPAP